ncbi:MAG: hypothetical protein KDE55_08190 [Novosphingobium sp.]|nr:hypothetical protein [Novosphingobium sp.]
MSRRALIRTDDLRRMARVVRSEGVTFHGRVDPLGNFAFTVAPSAPSPADDGDELDDAIDRYLGK